MSQLLSTCAHSAVNIWTQLPSAVKCRVKGDAGNRGRSWTIVLVGALHLPPYLYLPKNYKHLSSTKCSCGVIKVSAGHLTDTTTNHLFMPNWHFWPLKQNIFHCWLWILHHGHSATMQPQSQQAEIHCGLSHLSIMASNTFFQCWLLPTTFKPPGGVDVEADWCMSALERF